VSQGETQRSLAWGGTAGTELFGGKRDGRLWFSPVKEWLKEKSKEERGGHNAERGAVTSAKLRSGRAVRGT